MIILRHWERERGRERERESERESEREFAYIYFLLLWPFLLGSAATEEQTRGTNWYAWVTSGSLPSVKNYRPYIVSSFFFFCPKRICKYPLHTRIFLFMSGYRNLYTSVFFSAINWSNLRTEISVTLSLGNKLYSGHHILYFSFL